MIRRTYESTEDLDRLQAFNADAIAATDGCGFVHPGDIPHRIFNGNRSYDPAEVLTIWEDGDGIAGWVLTSVRHRGFDAQVRPDLRGGDLERAVLAHGEIETLRMISEHEIEADRLTTEAFRCDEVRAGLLRNAGWSTKGEPWVLNRRTLTDLETPSVADGYTVRPVSGLDEAAALATVHAAAFGSDWTAAAYREFMLSPAYQLGRELVVDSEQGELVAFTVIWLDHNNRTGLLEPVGTHPEHRRRGLGKALLQFALQQMSAAEMEHATVVNEGINEAAAALYRSVGFAPWYLLDQYTKPVPG